LGGGFFVWGGGGFLAPPRRRNGMWLHAIKERDKLAALRMAACVNVRMPSHGPRFVVAAHGQQSARGAARRRGLPFCVVRTTGSTNNATLDDRTQNTVCGC
jgi:hypothetical protein